MRMELLDLYDADGNRLGRTADRAAWVPVPGEYVKIIHLFIVNGEGESLIQRRAVTKKTWPGVWAILGGFVKSGEEPEQAVLREAAEEYGADLSACPRRRVLHLVREGRGAIMEFWLAAAEIPVEKVVCQPEEVEAAAYVTTAELYALYSEPSRWGPQDGAYRRAVLDVIQRLPRLHGELLHAPAE